MLIKRQSTKSNYLFQTIYQVLIWVVPLVISPYLTRKLGDTSLGIYTYVHSIAYYFLIVANLGIMKYGQRSIAECKDSETELRKCFWGIYTIHVIFSLFALFTYIGFVFVFVRDNRSVFFLNSLYVLSGLFDITWLFYGLENFKGVAIRNVLIKIGESVCIFLFVKQPSDLIIYTLIMSISIVISQLVLIPQAIASIKPIQLKRKEITKHMWPLVYFSISVVAITLYSIFDKTLLGILSSKENVAYYEYSSRIINVPKALISIIATILFPRVCNLVNNNKIEESKKYLKISITATSLLAFAAIFCILDIAKDFAVIYYGEAFSKTGIIMICMSPLIFIISMGDIIRLQYMIPNHKDKAYIICACCNAVVNLVLSIVLIPHMGVFGAIIGTLGAELFGFIFQMIYSRKFVSIYLLLKQSLPFAIIGFLVFSLMRAFSPIMGSGIIGLLIHFSVYCILYCALTALFLLKISSNRSEYKQFIKGFFIRKRKNSSNNSKLQ